MRNHYIPRLLLRKFGTDEKVNIYQISEKWLGTKKNKDVFAEKDIFDEELEQLFTRKIEGPFGDLLNHKLINGAEIHLTRNENLLMRSFFLLNNLRNPLWKNSFQELVEQTNISDHPTVKEMEWLKYSNPQMYKKVEGMYSEEQYYRSLKRYMEFDSLEKIFEQINEDSEDIKLFLSAQIARETVVSFWDSEECGQEFLLPRLQGISMMDYQNTFYKFFVMNEAYEKCKKKGMLPMLEPEWKRLLMGSGLYTDNFAMYPISPTRMMIHFSPYFRAFFPICDSYGNKVVPPFLGAKQFDKHFYKPMRMELFEPCKSLFNQNYTYQVKQLKGEEVLMLNSIILQMEPKEFVFHDFNKIRDSFWYYDHKAVFREGKKNDYSHLE